MTRLRFRSTSAFPHLPNAACALGVALLSLAACGGSGGGASTAPPPATGNLGTATLRAVSDQPTAAHEVVLATTLTASQAFSDVPVEYFLLNKEDVDSEAENVRQFKVQSSVFEAVNAGAGEYQSVVTIPQDVKPAGDYYLVASVDPEDVIAETDEDDNLPTQKSKVIVRIGGQFSDTADIVMETAAVDLDAVLLWPERNLRKVGQVDDVKNHDFGVSVTMTTTGRAPVDDVDLAATIDIPGQGQHRLQFWNKAATAYENRHYTRVEPGVPNTVHLDIAIPSAVRRLIEGHLRAKRPPLFKVSVAANEAGRIAEWELGSRRHSQRSDNRIETEVVIVLPPPGVSRGFGWEGNYDKRWQSDHFGVGIDLRGSAKFDSKGAHARASAGLPLRLFGQDFKALEFVAFSDALPKENEPTESEFGLDMKSFGQTLYSRSSVDPAYKRTWDWNVQKSKKKTKLFFVGPVPVSVEGGASATLGFRVDVHLDPAQFILEAGPYANAQAYAKAGVELVVVNVGVRGSVTLIEDTFTARVAAGVSIPQSGFLSGDLLLEVVNDLRGPYGKLDLYADRRVPKFCHKVVPCGIKTVTDTLTLVKFSTFRKTDVLFEKRDATIVQQ